MIMPHPHQVIDASAEYFSYVVDETPLSERTWQFESTQPTTYVNSFEYPSLLQNQAYLSTQELPIAESPELTSRTSSSRTSSSDTFWNTEEVINTSRIESQYGCLEIPWNNGIRAPDHHQLQSYTPEVTPTPTEALSGKYACDHCFGKSFTRRHDLDRHTNEQHKCPHCPQAFFPLPEDRKQHVKSSHSAEPTPFACGSCKCDQGSHIFFERGEKLKNHLVKYHQMSLSENWNSFRCFQRPCFISSENRGLYFPNKRDLELHESRYHSRANDLGPAINMTSTTLISEPLDLTINPGVLGFQNKHILEEACQPPAKRSKRKVDSAALTAINVNHSGPETQDLNNPVVGTPAENCLGKTSIQDTKTHSCESGINHTSAHVSEEISCVRVMEMHDIVKRYDFQTLLEELDSLKLSSCYDISKKSIRLEGTGLATKRGRVSVERYLKDIRDETGPQNIIRKDSGSRLQKTYTVPGDRPSQVKISILDPIEDADILATWFYVIVPRLPETLTPYLGKKYSASIVRQQVDDDYESVPTIRIRSAEGQSEAARKFIRRKLTKLCRDNNRAEIPVHFSQGGVTLLGGISGPSQWPDEASNDKKRFPHHKRWRKTPGMGASIGLAEHDGVSATLGGYILVNGRVYMMSVDHFIRYAEENSGIQHCLNVTSPSILDVRDLNNQLEQKLRDFGINAEDSCSVEQIPLAHIQQQLFPKSVDDELTHYKRFKAEISDDYKKFVLGSVRTRCTPDSIKTSCIQPYPDIKFRHKMDWSITAVNPSRIGKNKYRHHNMAELGVQDFDTELLYPEGVGLTCEDVADGRPGDEVFYFGQTSGFQCGRINPGLLECGSDSEEEEVYREWTFIVEDSAEKSASDYQGDSGAWVIRKSDNKVVGLLWGFSPGEHYFTPIRDVIADIEETLIAKVKLPPLRTPRNHNAPINICRIEPSVSREDYDSITVRQPLSRKLVAPHHITPILSLQTPDQDHSPIDTKLKTRRLSSPVPSLCSSMSSSPGARSPSITEPETATIIQSIEGFLYCEEPQDDSDEEHFNMRAATADALPNRKLRLEYILDSTEKQSLKEKSLTWPVSRDIRKDEPIFLTVVT